MVGPAVDVALTIAAALVVWSSLTAWCAAAGVALPFADVAADQVGALNVGEHARLLGLVLLALVGGLRLAALLTGGATVSAAASAALARAARPTAVLLGAVGVAWVVDATVTVPGGTARPAGATVTDTATGAAVPFDPAAIDPSGAGARVVADVLPAMPVLWTLVPLATAAALGAVLLPVWRAVPWLAVAAQLTACSVTLSAVSDAVSRPVAGGPDTLPAVVAAAAAFVPAITVGQLAWLVVTRRVAWWAAGALGVVAWTLVAWAERLGHSWAADAYPLAVAYGALTLGVLLAARVRAATAAGLAVDGPGRAVAAAVARRAWPLLLVCWPVAPPVLAALRDVPALAFVAATAAVVVTAEALHRLAALLPDGRGHA